MALTRRRQKDWRKALDAESFAAMVEKAIGLTSQASGGRHTTQISARIADPAVDIRATDPSEFRGDVRDAGSAEIERANGSVQTRGEASSDLDVHVIVLGARGSLSPTTDLVVSGEDRTWVEGIFAQLVEAIDRAFEAQERKEAEEVERERAAAEERERAVQQPSDEPAGRTHVEGVLHRPLRTDDGINWSKVGALAGVVSAFAALIALLIALL